MSAIKDPVPPERVHPINCRANSPDVFSSRATSSCRENIWSRVPYTINHCPSETEESMVDTVEALKARYFQLSSSSSDHAGFILSYILSHHRPSDPDAADLVRRMLLDEQMEPQCVGWVLEHD